MKNSIPPIDGTLMNTIIPGQDVPEGNGNVSVFACRQISRTVSSSRDVV